MVVRYLSLIVSLYLGITVGFFYLKFRKLEYAYGGCVMIITFMCISMNSKAEIKRLYNLDDNFKTRTLQMLPAKAMQQLAYNRYRQRVILK